MTKVKTRGTKTDSILLVIFIVAGIFTTLFPYFIIGAEAQPPIRVGDGPNGIAYDPGNKMMYVTNRNDSTVSIIDTTVNTVIGSIRVGGVPFDIAYDPVYKMMYVTNYEDKTVSVIDTTTYKVIDTNPNTPTVTDPIKVGVRPFDIAYDPVYKMMYVTNYEDKTVSVIDTTTNKVIDTNPNTPIVTDPIKVGVRPFDIAYDPVNKRMYVGNYQDGTVSVIDTTTNRVIDTNPNTPQIDPIKVGNRPLNIAYDPVNKRMYVGNYRDSTVSVIDTTTNRVIDTNPNTPTVTDPIKVGDGSRDIAYDPVNKRMYVSNSQDGTVSIINTTTYKVIGNPITVGKGFYGIAYDPGNRRMYMSNFDDDTVYVIDTTTNTVVGNPITVGERPSGIANDDSVNKRMYVSNFDDDTVSVISIISNKVMGSIKVGKGFYGIAYDLENKRIYVTNPSDNTVSVIDTTTNQVVDTNPNTPAQIDPIKVGHEPNYIAYDLVNGSMYVTNFDDNTVSVINTTTYKVVDTNPNTPSVIDPIKVGNKPVGIAYDSVNKRMYVSNYYENTVSVINTTTNKVIDTNPNTPQIDPIRVGDGPFDIAHDTVNKRMYVTNFGDDSVSVIDTTTNKVIDTNPNTPQIDPIKVGDGSRDIAYNTVNKKIYVSNFRDRYCLCN